MNYEEWSHLKRINDKKNPFSPAFQLPSGEIFYVEPAFYTQLSNFKEMYSLEQYQKFVDAMELLAKERKRVIFTYDYEHPLTHKENYILLEFIDIADYLKIHIEDKSRGSDYGD